jgi:hypothetical protein
MFKNHSQIKDEFGVTASSGNIPYNQTPSRDTNENWGGAYEGDLTNAQYH